MITLNIILGIVAAVLLIGVIGERDTQKQRSVTIAFVAVIVLIIAANIFFEIGGKQNGEIRQHNYAYTFGI